MTEVRQLHPSIRRRMAAVALTGYGSAADRKRAFDSGFDAHLAKPVDPARLIGVATKLTQRIAEEN